MSLPGDSPGERCSKLCKVWDRQRALAIVDCAVAGHTYFNTLGQRLLDLLPPQQVTTSTQSRGIGGGYARGSVWLSRQ
jgi:hypothetical protein